MSGIVLSASVRQNLLSLQSTADLLATTQNRLSTGRKVNTALDNPTNFFTAASLDNRASDISNLLDGIGNGVQVLQAAHPHLPPPKTPPAPSATFSTASATACRCCRPPIPASPRCRSWSMVPSRLPTRRYKPPLVIRPSPPLPARRSQGQTQATCAARLRPSPTPRSPALQSPARPRPPPS